MQKLSIYLQVAKYNNWFTDEILEQLQDSGNETKGELERNMRLLLLVKCGHKYKVAGGTLLSAFFEIFQELEIHIRVVRNQLQGDTSDMYLCKNHSDFMITDLHDLPDAVLQDLSKRAGNLNMILYPVIDVRDHVVCLVSVQTGHGIFRLEFDFVQ